MIAIPFYYTLKSLTITKRDSAIVHTFIFPHKKSSAIASQKVFVALYFSFNMIHLKTYNTFAISVISFVDKPVAEIIIDVSTFNNNKFRTISRFTSVIPSFKPS